MTERDLIGVAERVTLVQYYARLYGGLKFAASRASEQARLATLPMRGRPQSLREKDAERCKNEAQRLCGAVIELLAEAKAVEIDEHDLSRMADVMHYERELLADQIAASARVR